MPDTTDDLSTKGNVIFFAVLFGLPLMLVLFSTPDPSVVKSKAFNASLKEAGALYQIQQLGNEKYKYELVKQLYIRGTVLPIMTAFDDGTIVIDHTGYKGLDLELKPSSWRDARTLLLKRRNSKKVGEYTDGSDAIQIRFEVSLIDLDEGIIYYQKQYDGGDPPRTIERRYGMPYAAGGADPTYMITSFLNRIENRITDSINIDD